MAHERAKEAAKREFGRQCIFTGMTGFDGMHFYPAQEWPELADIVENIFPGTRGVHSQYRPCFDTRADNSPRPVSERRWMLENMVIDDFRQQVKIRIMALHDLCLEIGVPWFAAEEPVDEKILRNSNGTGWKTALAGNRDAQDAQILDSDGWQAGSGNNERLEPAPFG